jgi:galactokinase
MDVSSVLGTERGSSVVWAPGRVNLIGEHTDYSGGLVLPAAIQLGITLTVTAVTDDVVLSSSSFGPADPFSADGGGPAATGWARYGQAVAAELAALGRPAVGLSGTVDSGLPPGVGLSSSAALEVAIALGLCTVADFELEPLQIALACQRAELRAVGVPCGILDQAACLLGRSGSAILLDCWTLEYRPVAIPVEGALLIVDSGVARALEASPYAERREQLELAMRLVGAQRSTDVSTRDLDGLDDVPLRRLRHVVTENGRVRRFAEALEGGRLDDAGSLLHESHVSLRDDYEVSIAELDLLVELAEANGAYGARLLGGGFGGAILALVPKSKADEIGRTIAADYRKRTGLDGTTLTVFPSAGARLQPT